MPVCIGRHHFHARWTEHEAGQEWTGRIWLSVAFGRGCQALERARIRRGRLLGCCEGELVLDVLQWALHAECARFEGSRRWAFSKKSLELCILCAQLRDLVLEIDDVAATDFATGGGVDAYAGFASLDTRSASGKGLVALDLLGAASLADENRASQRLDTVRIGKVGCRGRSLHLFRLSLRWL
jgi:hypothetical protein